MRLLAKDEACRELRMFLSTLDRRISAGDLMVRREPRGRRHRVFVVIDDGPYDTNGATSVPSNVGLGETQLAVTRERRSGLEEWVKLLQGQLEWEQQRNVELFSALNEGGLIPTSRQRRRAWWKCWDRR